MHHRMSAAQELLRRGWDTNHDNIKPKHLQAYWRDEKILASIHRSEEDPGRPLNLHRRLRPLRRHRLRSHSQRDERRRRPRRQLKAASFPRVPSIFSRYLRRLGIQGTSTPAGPPTELPLPQSERAGVRAHAGSNQSPLSPRRERVGVRAVKKPIHPLHPSQTTPHPPRPCRRACPRVNQATNPPPAEPSSKSSRKRWTEATSGQPSEQRQNTAA